MDCQRLDRGNEAAVRIRLDDVALAPVSIKGLIGLGGAHFSKNAMGTSI
jgi:hypothetical protein